MNKQAQKVFIKYLCKLFRLFVCWSVVERTHPPARNWRHNGRRHNSKMYEEKQKKSKFKYVSSSPTICRPPNAKNIYCRIYESNFLRHRNNEQSVNSAFVSATKQSLKCTPLNPKRPKTSVEIKTVQKLGDLGKDLEIYRRHQKERKPGVLAFGSASVAPVYFSFCVGE